MQKKLYLGVLIILLAIFGKALEANTIPNQQIIIQFSDIEISELDANNTIDAIRKKLNSIGAEQIQIGQDAQGNLKISYYSAIEVAQIELMLSNSADFEISQPTDNTNKIPEDNGFKDYKLNVSEIQKGGNTNWDFDGVQVTELNQKTDRLSNPKIISSGHHVGLESTNNLINVFAKVTQLKVLAIDNFSYKIPEVRAGPAV